jgi:hypothetical protein
MASKVNVGTRTKSEDDAALSAFIAAETSQPGKKLVEEGGQKFIVETTATGLTIKTRVA